MRATLVIYVHGFLCTNNPPRVSALRQHVEEHQLAIDVVSPRLPGKPRAAITLLETLIETQAPKYESIVLIGHSLGAYFSTYLVSKYHLKAVLLNPVIHGYEIMCEYLGECYSPHFDEHFEITMDDIEYLVGLDVETIPHKQNVMVLQQLGDEIIDQRKVSSYFDGCRLLIEEGGNHDYANFEQHLEMVVAFLCGHETE